METLLSISAYIISIIAVFFASAAFVKAKEKADTRSIKNLSDKDDLQRQLEAMDNRLFGKVSIMTYREDLSRINERMWNIQGLLPEKEEKKCPKCKQPLHN